MSYNELSLNQVSHLVIEFEITVPHEVFSFHEKPPRNLYSNEQTIKTAYMAYTSFFNFIKGLFYFHFFIQNQRGVVTLKLIRMKINSYLDDSDDRVITTQIEILLLLHIGSRDERTRQRDFLRIFS